MTCAKCNGGVVSTGGFGGSAVALTIEATLVALQCDEDCIS